MHSLLFKSRLNIFDMIMIGSLTMAVSVAGWWSLLIVVPMLLLGARLSVDMEERLT